MDGTDLAWRVEEACRNAWPAPREAHLGGWLLRAAGGPTRRTNAVNPLRGPRAGPEAAVAACEAVFRGLGRLALFRIVSLAPELDPALARQGYAAEGASLTLVADLAGDLAELGASEDRVSLAEAPDAAWLAFRAAVNRSDPEAERAYRAMHGAILLPRACATLCIDGAIAAQAYGVLDGDLVVIESVATEEACRGRGYSRRVVSALMRWGRSRGATAACLQVVADNAPARALYAGLGFDREVSRYHYRRAPEADSGSEAGSRRTA
ncbi:GNAT family N-acetyltransferase [Methylobacterium radiodurans]|uniref:N-acetyltransferase n=1 Tax=Methylobacterium radiodurans TaxID=2202828 RepID=A0A2U8VU67_9HYPH|nr:GNAT family N-acetyltransferase [Methylobacterium radiodurans]AWN37225.1 N-acetyltransferase [Methylobacterium radiodurans]